MEKSTVLRMALLGGLGTLLVAGCGRPGAGPAAELELGSPADRADLWNTLPPARRLTDSSADQVAPAFSPDGGQLVYQSNADGNWELYLLDLASGQSRRLTDTPEEEEDPSWSPDGRWILCTVHGPSLDDAPPRDILLLGVDGQQRREVARHGADDWFPRFAPDGASIWFISDRDDVQGGVADEERHSALYRFDLASETVTRLTHDGDVSAPLPMADGQVLLRTGLGRFERLQQDAGRALVLDDADWILGQPAAGPAGQLFLAGQPRQGGESRLLLLPAGSQNPQALPNQGREADRQPALSPDGRRLAFAGRSAGQWDLYLHELPGPPSPGTGR
jgi:Tol biopolymer transport system component